MTSDKYRDRPSEEITREQKELERLRMFSRIRGTAWWEFNTDTYQFEASRSCRKLTGYSLKQVFPVDLSRETNPVEPKLDNLVDKFCSFVTPEFKEEFREKISDFFIWSRKDQTFDYGFRMKRADGQIIAVWVVAYAAWEHGRLTGLVCQMREIDSIASPIGAGVAIAKNEAQIEKVDEALERVSSRLKNAKTWGPLLLVAAVSFNNGLELLIAQANRFVKIVSGPIRSARLSQADKRAILPSSITSEDLDKAQAAMRSATDFGTVTLAVYEPGYFPGNYRLLIQSSRRQDINFGNTSTPISTSLNPQVARMTDLHLAGQAFEIPPTDTFVYSVPFAIELSNGAPQVFYVEIESTSKEVEKLRAIRGKTVKTAAIIKELLRE